MKKIFPLVTITIVVLLIIMACKKNSNTNPVPATTNNPSPLFVPDGQFEVNNFFNDNTLFAGNPNDSGSKAYTILIGSPNIGTVSVNSNSLTIQYTLQYILTNVIAPLHGKATWQVTGGNGFGAFTYTTSKSIPSFTNLHLSISSITTTGNVIITHPIITADSIKYCIIDANYNKAIKTVGNSSTGITFTPAMMALLSTTTNATIQVTGTNTENSVQGGKNISFLNSAAYIKTGVAIN
jgi:hypothetical protein